MMARFANTMGIDKIEIHDKVRCFCPIGRSWCTYELDVFMVCGDVIPDYIEVGEYLKTHIQGKEYTLEQCCANVHGYFKSEYDPVVIDVKVHCKDARHMPVTVSKGSVGRKE